MLLYSVPIFNQLLKVIRRNQHSLNLKYSTKWIFSNAKQEKEFDFTLANHLASILSCWKLQDSKMEKFDEDRFRKSLTHSQIRLNEYFEKLGFVKGKPQCVVRAFQLIEQNLQSFFTFCKLKNSKWMVLHTEKWSFDSPHWKLLKKKLQTSKPEFIIVYNQEYSSLPPEFIGVRDNKLKKIPTISGYQIHSFVSLEIHDGFNHYRNTVIDSNHVIMYNDILHFGIKGGGYQGFVTDIHGIESNSPFISLLVGLCSHVPIAIFKKQSMDQ